MVLQSVVDNAAALADRLQDHGLHLVSGGTDTHLVLVDLRESHPETTGQAVERALESVGLVANKNTVPGETRSPFVASGVRIGTPAVTTRGFDETAMRELADVVARVVDATDKDGALPADVEREASATVGDLCERFPLYR